LFTLKQETDMDDGPKYFDDDGTEVNPNFYPQTTALFKLQKER